MFLISLSISVNKLSAGLPSIISLTPLPIKGVNIFSCPPASKIVSAITEVPAKLKPPALTLQPIFQEYNNLPVILAKRSRGEFLIFSLPLFKVLIPKNIPIILITKIYIICSKAKNKIKYCKGKNNNKCFFLLIQ